MQINFSYSIVLLKLNIDLKDVMTSFPLYPRGKHTGSTRSIKVSITVIKCSFVHSLRLRWNNCDKIKVLCNDVCLLFFKSQFSCFVFSTYIFHDLSLSLSCWFRCATHPTTHPIVWAFVILIWNGKWTGGTNVGPTKNGTVKS